MGIGTPAVRGRAAATALVLVAVLIWGSTYVGTKGGVDDAPPMLFALMRYCVASAILVAVVLSRPGSAKLPRATPRGTLFLRGVTGIASRMGFRGSRVQIPPSR